MQFLFWIAFIVFILALIGVDLFMSRDKKEPTLGHSLLWTLFWVFVALLFNVFIYFLYEHEWLGFTSVIPGGKVPALQFFTGYIVEKSLSLDNIFVIAFIFSYFQIPLKYQHEVLFWGILGAIVLRFIMIMLGLALLNAFHFMNYVFGFLLFATAIRMFFMKHEEIDPEKNYLIRWMRRLMPVTPKLHEDHFFVRLNGILHMTPLFLALIVVETTDVFFAIDSIPAIFAITKDPFLVFSSNVFAILGLRSLYFVLAHAINKFYYLRYSLIFLLAFVGLKMMLMEVYPIDLTTSLYIIIAILAFGVLASYCNWEKLKNLWDWPSYPELRELAVITLKETKRLVALIIGITFLILGIIFLTTPAYYEYVLLPIGIFLIVREVIWASKTLINIQKK